MAEMTPEQRKELEEKLKNMSPEELREFQKQQCIFCQLISGKVPTHKVFEDEKCVAILDKFPSNPGHLLVLPKEHYMIMPQVPEGDIKHMFMVAKSLSQALIRALKVEGTNIFVANGGVAGQKAQHFMIHVIPRKENDGIPLNIPESTPDPNKFEEIKKLFSHNIAKMFKLPPSTGVAGEPAQEGPDLTHEGVTPQEEAASKDVEVVDAPSVDVEPYGESNIVARAKKTLAEVKDFEQRIQSVQDELVGDAQEQAQAEDTLEDVKTFEKKVDDVQQEIADDADEAENAQDENQDDEELELEEESEKKGLDLDAIADFLGGK